MAYRQGRISVAQVRTLLGHESRWQTENFLAAHEAWPGTTAEEALGDLDSLRALEALGDSRQ